MAITTGVKKSSDITAAATTAGVGQAPDRRRLYSFGDRVAELAPEESPFFVYLSKVAKVPTDDPVFRFLENRSKIDWTSREFFIDASGDQTVAAGSDYSFTVESATGSSTTAGRVSWLVKGMVFSVNTVDDSANGWALSQFRVISSPVANSADTTFSATCISTSNQTGSTTVSDEDRCQVIGTSFAEGTGAPDAWSSEIEDDFGYTQIFKTAAEMSNTAVATRYRGYADEWSRIWALKLREHKVDIERAMLFGQRARQNSIQYTEGLVGHIVKNGTAQMTDATALSYSSGVPYYRSVANMSYDVILGDMEVLFDPARGGSADKLVLASLPTITIFNKLSSTGFVDLSIANEHRYNFEASKGAFGHNIMKIETVHGNLHMVKEPLFRGVSAGCMLVADMGKLAYRPLVGNGMNRDTAVETNVQAPDEDLRKDMILTEAGLEITLPEAHMLYNMEGA
jgi:hypothetical protein